MSHHIHRGASILDVIVQIITSTKVERNTGCAMYCHCHYIVTYYIKWVTTSWTDSMTQDG